MGSELCFHTFTSPTGGLHYPYPSHCFAVGAAAWPPSRTAYCQPRIRTILKRRPTTGLVFRIGDLAVAGVASAVATEWLWRDKRSGDRDAARESWIPAFAGRAMRDAGETPAVRTGGGAGPTPESGRRDAGGTAGVQAGGAAVWRFGSRGGFLLRCCAATAGQAPSRFALEGQGDGGPRPTLRGWGEVDATGPCPPLLGVWMRCYDGGWIREG